MNLLELLLEQDADRLAVVGAPDGLGQRRGHRQDRELGVADGTGTEFVHTTSVTSSAAASFSRAPSANRPCVQAMLIDLGSCSRSTERSSITVVPRAISSSTMITSRSATSPMIAEMDTLESLNRSLAPAATGRPSRRANGRRGLGVADGRARARPPGDRSRRLKCAASSRSACRWSTGTEKKPCTSAECRVSVSTRFTPAVTSKSGDVGGRRSRCAAVFLVRARVGVMRHDTPSPARPSAPGPASAHQQQLDQVLPVPAAPRGWMM